MMILLGCGLAAALPSATATGTSVAAGTSAAAGRSSSSRGPAARLPAELAAIRTELNRGVDKLRLPGSAEPYRAEARMVRAELLSLDGSYGGLISNVFDRQAAGAAEVRVGSIARDNTNFFGSDSGVVRLDVALEAAPKFAAKKLWLALDQSFRGASRAWAQKRIALERLAIADHSADYSPPPEPTQHLEKFSWTDVDRAGLAALVTNLSGRFADHPEIDNGDVHLQMLRTVETVVNTDGMALQWARDRAFLAVTADTKAPDGMVLDHGAVLHFAVTPVADDELRTAGEQLVDRVLVELEELAAAPMIDEDYDGPILFVGQAAPQLLASTVATEAVGTPAPLSESGRMVDLEPSWQPKLGKQVLPPFLDLVDDPGLAGGFGSYRVDAEGVTASRLNLVRDGRLTTLLMTRVPNPQLGRSNGRARMSPALEVAATVSNLALSSRRRGSSMRQLERELINRAQDDGYDFAYVIESLRDGIILGSVPRDSATAYAGTGAVNLPLPGRVWRIDGSGNRTLVRGAILAPSSIRALRRIRVVGADSTTLAMRIPVGPFGGFASDVGIDGALSQTVDIQVASPALLIDGLELLVERGEHQRLPTLRHPLRRKPPVDDTANERPGTTAKK